MNLKSALTAVGRFCVSALISLELAACNGTDGQRPPTGSGEGPSPFTDHRDGTISDARTNLMWTRECGESAMPWNQAVQFCDAITTGGHSDWRLPTMKELRGLYESLGQLEKGRDRRRPPFAWGEAHNHWSADRYLSYTTAYWTYFFHSGFEFPGQKGNPDGHVRAVRLADEGGRSP
jgi:hypothetical protein